MSSLPVFLEGFLDSDTAGLVLDFVPEHDYADAKNVHDAPRVALLESRHGITTHTASIVDGGVDTTCTYLFDRLHSLHGRPAISRRFVRTLLEDILAVDVISEWMLNGHPAREHGLPVFISQTCTGGRVHRLVREWSRPPSPGAPVYELFDEWRSIVGWDPYMGRDWFSLGCGLGKDPHAPRPHPFSTPMRIELREDSTSTSYTRAVPERPDRPEPQTVTVCHSTRDGVSYMDVSVHVCIPCRLPAPASGPHFCNPTLGISRSGCGTGGAGDHVECARAVLGVELGGSTGRGSAEYLRRYDLIDSMCPFRLAEYIPRPTRKRRRTSGSM
jgi:hypothetical protein